MEQPCADQAPAANRSKDPCNTVSRVTTGVFPGPDGNLLALKASDEGASVAA